MELKPNMYVRTKYGIFKIRKITKDLAYWKHEKRVLELDRNIPEYNYRFSFYKDESIFKGVKFKDNIIDLIEYMDLLVIENKLKDIDNREIYLFNPVRCDGFTTFEDGKHCMIINMDYIIPIENIKVYQVLTHEQFNNESYKMGQ